LPVIPVQDVRSSSRMLGFTSKNAATKLSHSQSPLRSSFSSNGKWRTTRNTASGRTRWHSANCNILSVVRFARRLTPFPVTLVHYACTLATQSKCIRKTAQGRRTSVRFSSTKPTCICADLPPLVRSFSFSTSFSR